MEKNAKERSTDLCVGKLRANVENDKFTLYDNGENFQKAGKQDLKLLRCEHGYFSYRYEPCNVGNIRKMIIIFPTVYPTNCNGEQLKAWKENKDFPETIYNMASADTKLQF